MITRPAIAAPLKRSVLIEAGHRCAIPTCRLTPVEIAHIVPWADVREHTFENLIALCPTCHTRYDRGDIDRASMRSYKWNLAVISSRYGDLERRLLAWFNDHPGEHCEVGGSRSFDFMYLLADGLIERVRHEPVRTARGTIYKLGLETYALTEAGTVFLGRWMSGLPIS